VIAMRRAEVIDGALPPRKPHARWDKTCKPLPRPVPQVAITAEG
jgi:hypothetical protein